MVKNYCTTTDIEDLLNAVCLRHGLSGSGEAIRFLASVAAPAYLQRSIEYRLPKGAPSLARIAAQRRARFEIRRLPLELRPAFLPWHNDGTPNVPQRKIIVRPDGLLEALMRADAKRAVEKLMRKAGKV